MGLLTTTIFNTKIGEVERKIPGVTGLVTITPLNTKVENKASSVSNLVKEMKHNAKITDTEAKYFTAVEYNKFISKLRENKI